jgi:hypothetical protein
MVVQTKITLDWYQDVANVFEQNDGRLYEIGTVVLKRLAMAVVGCTYYHHVKPCFGGSEENSVMEYEGDLNRQDQALSEVLKRLRELQKQFPEISGEGLRLDEEEDFIDLAIAIEFAVPYQPSEPYEEAIQEAVLKYADLLGTMQTMELIEKKGL